MCKINYNAVYYSKGNVERAYEIKNALWKSDYQVTNIFDFSELVCEIGKGINLLIVDSETIEASNELLSFINNCKFGIIDNVIFVGETKVNVSDNLSRFEASYLNFISVFNLNLPKFEFNINKNKASKFNINFVNTYLTQYLISLGFLPKHVGFYYIKQCIEEAILKNSVLGSLSSQIYPSVARRNGTTAVNIERNIRNSINCANKNSNNKELSLQNITKNKSVSNRAFLSFLLDQVIISHNQMLQNFSA